MPRDKYTGPPATLANMRRYGVRTVPDPLQRKSSVLASRHDERGRLAG
jgi:hypothetical protein